MLIKLPFDKDHIEADIPDWRIKAVLEPKAPSDEAPDQERLVKEALENPIASPRLSELAKRKILVITSDHTRPVPSRITLPLLLEEIRRGSPDAEIKVLVATGLHRAMTPLEMEERFGPETLAKEEIINHDSRDESKLVFKGILPSGGELWLNSLIDWADLTVAEGFIEPHFFAGYSGGRKSVLPGIASEKTVRANHCSKFIADPNAVAGSLEHNPIHKDMLFAAKAAKMGFILNVALDPQKRIVAAFAGDSEKAHEAGTKFMEDQCGVDAVMADIVISTNGGYPLDQNIYQAVKGMTAAESCVNPGGVIIMVAGCRDGHGGEMFRRFFADASSPQELLDKIIATRQEDTLSDQWEAQILARILAKSRVIFVCKENAKKDAQDMFMKYASTLEEALEEAGRLAGSDSKITVIPDGVSLIVRRV
ncbi:MAG: nickel-dependent lactate racemase [Clostridiales bacterium]|jgi:nickel-dependent lactate racemase|nr:nickel-dependent lactate racemase [Clostridiales bacterium]